MRDLVDIKQRELPKRQAFCSTILTFFVILHVRKDDLVIDGRIVRSRMHDVEPFTRLSHLVVRRTTVG